MKVTDQSVILPGHKSPTLQWQRSETKRMTHSDAMRYCSNLDLEGRSGWRLPTIEELFTLVDFGKSKPAGDGELFPSLQPHYYWSSTFLKGRETSAWYVYFYSGGVGYDRTTGMGYVRCVRIMN